MYVQGLELMALYFFWRHSFVFLSTVTMASIVTRPAPAPGVRWFGSVGTPPLRPGPSTYRCLSVGVHAGATFTPGVNSYPGISLTVGRVSGVGSGLGGNVRGASESVSMAAMIAVCLRG